MIKTDEPYKFYKKQPNAVDLSWWSYFTILSIIAEEAIDEAIFTGSKVKFPSGFVLEAVNICKRRFFFKNIGVPRLTALKFYPQRGHRGPLSVFKANVTRSKTTEVFNKFCEASKDLDLVNTYPMKYPKK